MPVTYGSVAAVVIIIIIIIIMAFAAPNGDVRYFCRSVTRIVCANLLGPTSRLSEFVMFINSAHSLARTWKEENGVEPKAVSEANALPLS